MEHGGEGLMLKAPQCTYASKRSKYILKVKKLEDAEAEVVGHLPGKGKHEGVLGALQVKGKNGKTFKIQWRSNKTNT